MRLLFLFLSIVSLSAHADLKCEADLNYGMVVTDKSIRIIDESRTLYQINSDDQLIVGGNWITLNESQTEKLKELSDGIHYSVPKMIILATEGVDLAIETVEHVYVGLVGTDHKSFDKLTSALDRVKEKVKKKFIHAHGNYYIGPGSLENVDDLVDQELEAQIEEAINTSLGGVLSAIGGLNAGNDESMELRMEELSQRLEVMGNEIERTVGPKADSLRKKAQWFCNKMGYLDRVENELRTEIKQLKDIDVIVVGKGWSD
ncbi:YggN family protein [Planctobacterium marinum]|uniref:YggN family protein n=1 Tax=Planctobacterium marinum TaxID=1631968 RepID=UPI003CC82AAA